MIEKAQTAIEYYTIVAVALLILLPLSVYVYQLLYQYGDDTKLSHARNAVDQLGETADWVFSQGPPAKYTFESFYIPEGVKTITIDNDGILFKVKTSAGISDVYYQTITPLDGSIPTESGYYPISVTAYDTYVNISVVQ
jgi:hypothetical protein